MSKFAADTSVSVEKSRAEIEGLVIRYGATHIAAFAGGKFARRPTCVRAERLNWGTPVCFHLPANDEGDRCTRTALRGRFIVNSISPLGSSRRDSTVVM